MALDVEKLVKDMTDGAAKELARKWPKARAFAEPQLRRLADELARIEALRAVAKITPEDAQDQIELQKEAFRSVMSTVEGIAELVVERTLNAALAAIRAPVEKILGFPLV